MVQTSVSMIGTNQHDIIQKLVKKAGEKITSAEKHTLECETNLNEARKASENLSKKTNKKHCQDIDDDVIIESLNTNDTTIQVTDDDINLLLQNHIYDNENE